MMGNIVFKERTNLNGMMSCAVRSKIERTLLLAGVQVGIGSRSGLSVKFPKGRVGISISNRARIVGQRAGAALPIVQVIVRRPAA